VDAKLGISSIWGRLRSRKGDRVATERQSALFVAAMTVDDEAGGGAPERRSGPPTLYPELLTHEVMAALPTPQFGGGMPPAEVVVTEEVPALPAPADRPITVKPTTASDQPADGATDR